MSVSGPPARIDEPRPGFAVRPTLRVVPAQPAPLGGFDPHGAPCEAIAPSERAFGDLVLLVALACQAPAALLSVPGPDGTWQSLAHGFDSTTGLDDPLLFELIAGSSQLVEIADMTKGRPAESPLTAPPHLMRWAFGVALRDHYGSVGAVLTVLDRGFRQISGREQRALKAAARQLVTIFARAEQEGSVISPADAFGRVAAGWPQLPGGAGRIAAVGSVPAGLSRLAPGGLSPVVGGSPAGGLDSVERGRGRDLLRSHEVAEIFNVTERTVVNWAAAGKLPSLRTVGGHLRFRHEEIQSVLAEVRAKGRRARFGRPGYALVERGHA